MFLSERPLLKRQIMSCMMYRISSLVMPSTNTRVWTQGFQKPGNVHFEPAAYTAMATFIYSAITNSSSSTHVMS